MVGTDAISQDPDALKAARRPLRGADPVHPRAVPAGHAAGLGHRSVGQAAARAGRGRAGSGADTVVVHPPFRWQRDYAREFVAGLARMRSRDRRALRRREHVPVARRPAARSAPTCPTGTSATTTTRTRRSTCRTPRSRGATRSRWRCDLGDRLAHVHLADGTDSARDEHLIPGRGDQPVAQVLTMLAGRGFDGTVIVEVSTRRAPDRAASGGRSRRGAGLRAAAPRPSDRTGA